MEGKGFSLQIGSLLFTGQSIKYIIYRLFLLGFIVGMYSTIHIENPETPVSLTIFPLFAVSLMPLYLIRKGIKRAKDVSGN